MKINNKISIVVAVMITVNLINFNLNSNYALSQVTSIKKQSEIYMPKSTSKITEKAPVKKNLTIQKSDNLSKPVIKEKIKPQPALKAKVAPSFNAFQNTYKTDLFLKNIDITSALKIIAKEGRKSIVIDKSIKGLIDVNYKNITLNEAMQRILTVQNLEATVKDSTIFVSKSKLANISPLEVKPQIRAKTIAPVQTKIVTAAKPVIHQAQIQNVSATKPVLHPAISLSFFIKKYNEPYSKTFLSTLSALAASKVEILSFNSLEGKIYARLSNHKNIYVLIRSINSKSTSVRITPADGVYDIPDAVIKGIFDNIYTNNYAETQKKV